MSGLDEMSYAAPDTGHVRDVVCEEDDYGDPAPVVTALCPRTGDA
jgi:hypothetical protein